MLNFAVFSGLIKVKKPLVKQLVEFRVPRRWFFSKQTIKKIGFWVKIRRKNVKIRTRLQKEKVLCFAVLGNGLFPLTVVQEYAQKFYLILRKIYVKIL